MSRLEALTVDVRELPHVRQIAEFICENGGDKDQVQRALWRIDAMATVDVEALYAGMRAARAEAQ